MDPIIDESEEVRTINIFQSIGMSTKVHPLQPGRVQKEKPQSEPIFQPTRETIDVRIKQRLRRAADRTSECQVHVLRQHGERYI